VKAMFANLTPSDFRGRSQRERRAAERKRVHALFDVIQVAIHARDRATVDDLMAALAMATMAEVHEPGDKKSTRASSGQETEERFVDDEQTDLLWIVKNRDQA
jgi:hypothetical protein